MEKEAENEEASEVKLIEEIGEKKSTEQKEDEIV